MENQTAAYWITHLQLQPHPEGGFYKEVFRSGAEVMRPPSLLPKKACTSIYYLLEGTDFPAFTVLRQMRSGIFTKGRRCIFMLLMKTGNML